MKFIYRLLSIPNWVKALRNIRKDNYVQALYYLNNIKPTIMNHNYEYIILRAFSYMATNKYENAIIDCAHAFINIKNSKKLTKDEYVYLKKYIFFILCSSHKMKKDYNIKECFEKYNSLTYCEDNISSRILKLFPQPKRS